MTAHNIKIPHQSIPRHLFISGFMRYDFVCNARAATFYTHTRAERLSTSSYPVDIKTADFSETLLSVDESAIRNVPEECILHFPISLNGF
jgi:hypothetical protein